MPRNAVGALIALGLLFTSPLTASSSSDESRISWKQERFDSPYANPEEFYQFMAKGPGWSRELIEEAFPRESTSRCINQEGIVAEKIRYRGKGGWVNGWIVAPEQRQSSPLIIYNRGGFARWGRLLALDRFVFCRLAERGFTVMASDFRGNSEGDDEDRTDLGDGDVHDSLALISVAQEWGGVDTERIGIYGFSRGASITGMMLTHLQNVRAVVAVGGLVDATAPSRREEFDTHVYPLLVPGWAELPRAEKDERLRRISPLHLIDQIQGKPAFLVLHGNQDWRASASQALRYAASLTDAEHRVSVHLADGAGHALVEVYPWMVETIIDWFEQNLNDEES